jgi:hypothetical protein
MMNYTTGSENWSSEIENRPYVHNSIINETENLEVLITDTIRMIENTQSFLERLDRSQSNAGEHLKESAQRLERSLDSLRHRRDELNGSYNGTIC